LGAIATHADVDLGVAVAPAQTRAPWLLAATAATLSHLSGGRFTLGVGTSSEVIVAGWSGLPFDRPLARLRETVLLLRELLGGERVNHEGEFLTVSGYRLFAPLPAPIPVVIGALNPRSLRQAGELGDGVCLNQLGVPHLERALTEVRLGATAAGRSFEDLSVVARLFCWATDDVPAARAAVRRTFAPYAATTVYNRFFRWLGYGEEMDAVDGAAAQRDRAGMSAALSDDLVDTLYIVGDDDHVAERVRAYLDGGVTTAAIASLAPTLPDAERTFAAAAKALG
jgi:probable F420-dependent oxidoreductase